MAQGRDGRGEVGYPRAVAVEGELEVAPAKKMVRFDGGRVAKGAAHDPHAPGGAVGPVRFDVGLASVDDGEPVMGVTGGDDEPVLRLQLGEIKLRRVPVGDLSDGLQPVRGFHGSGAGR